MRHPSFGTYRHAMNTVSPSTGTGTKIAADIRAGLRSARDVLDACLARIASLDPEIGAFQVVDAEAARAEADALGTRADLARPTSGRGSRSDQGHH
jgi:Asp-tRNA(Asn)/Glu-tRNA(Gln) amidotransferase A subunit family amidase